jgi:thymidylate synthase (FAD)
MELINPSFEILTPQSQIDGMLHRIEAAGRTCYKSEDKMTDISAKEFVEKIIRLGHDSVLEHEYISVRVITDRGITHEIVRHRLASYSQESTRYCNYGNTGIKFINPDFILTQKDWTFLEACEQQYMDSLERGLSPQQARYFLPNGLKTEIVMTLNLRAWLHFFNLRTAKAAHPQMRQITIPMHKAFQELVPVVFN